MKRLGTFVTCLHVLGMVLCLHRCLTWNFYDAQGDSTPPRVHGIRAHPITPEEIRRPTTRPRTHSVAGSEVRQFCDIDLSDGDDDSQLSSTEIWLVLEKVKVEVKVLVLKYCIVLHFISTSTF